MEIDVAEITSYYSEKQKSELAWKMAAKPIILQNLIGLEMAVKPIRFAKPIQGS